MTLRNWAARALVLLPLLPVACSAGDESQGGARRPYGNAGTDGSDAGSGASAGYGGVSGFGGTGPTAGGSGGLAGGGGLGATGGIAGEGGTGTVGSGGTGTVGTGGTGTVGTGGSGATTGREPIIPPVTAQCPAFRDGTITFMGLGGIQVRAGAKAAGPTAPMVFYWHGTGSTAGEFAAMAPEVLAGVTGEGGVLVSFQGTTGGDLLSGTSIFGAGDFELTDQLVACAVRDHNVNPRRIFATGCSAGGLFSTAMATRRSNYIAAAAPNSGGLIVGAQWQNDYTPALMTIHGSNDVVGVNFADTSRTADTAFKNRGGFVINCNTGAGHCSGRPAAASIWEFFKAHPYGVSPHPWTSLPAGFYNRCQIF